MMLSTFALTMPRALRLDALRILASTMVQWNARWIREQLSRGVKPPASLREATAPFAPRGVIYVEHHGDPVGASRVYQDGMTAMSTGRATCFDVCCYDAPASTLVLGVPMTVELEPMRDDDGLRCHVWMLDARGTKVDPTRAMRREGA